MRFATMTIVTSLLMAQAPAPEPAQTVKEMAFEIGFCFGRNEVIEMYEGRKSVLKQFLGDTPTLRATLALLDPPKTNKPCDEWKR